LVQPEIEQGERSLEVEKQSSINAEADADLSLAGLSGSVGARVEASRDLKDKILLAQKIGAISVSVNRGPSSFVISLLPRMGNSLEGEPWAGADRIAQVKVKGRVDPADAPELKIEIRCKMEDLDVTDVQIDTSMFAPLTDPLASKRKLAVEQYIKSQLMENGLYEGQSLKGRFSDLVLADALTLEDEGV